LINGVYEIVIELYKIIYKQHKIIIVMLIILILILILILITITIWIWIINIQIIYINLDLLQKVCYKYHKIQIKINNYGNQ
jgi:hypothetical protein